MTRFMPQFTSRGGFVLLPDAPKASKPLAKRIRQHAAIETCGDNKKNFEDLRRYQAEQRFGVDHRLYMPQNKEKHGENSAEGRRFGCH